MLVFESSINLTHPLTQLPIISKGTPLTLEALQYLGDALGYDCLLGTVKNSQLCDVEPLDVEGIESLL